MDFSIVVPYYNADRYIERCAQALLDQNYPQDRYEIILVENNSKDQSTAILERFDRLRILHEPQQGSYAARNRGVEAATGEIIAFTDPDCAPRQDWLQQIASALASPDVGMVLGNRLFASTDHLMTMLAAYESGVVARTFAGRHTASYFAYTNNMAVRRSIFEELGEFKEIMRGADSLFLRQAAERYGAHIVNYAHEMVVTHLEMVTIEDYLRKKKTYGMVTANNRDMNPPTSLPLTHRIKLAIQAMSGQQGSIRHLAEFGTVLARGAIRFAWERARHKPK
jgi:glycosyltransferase involved in cell wall biosynthesis